MVERSHTDPSMVEALRRGSLSARDELVRQYYTRVLRFFELRAGAEADDLAQQTFLACFESFSRIQNGTSVRAFLFGIARNKLLMYLRSKHRDNPAGAQREASVVDPRTGMSTLITREQEQYLVLRAVADLDPGDQMLVVLHYWEEMSPTEIANALDVPAPTIRTRLFRARRSMREIVGELSVPGRVRDSAVGHLEAWTRSIATGVFEPGRAAPPGDEG